MIMNLSPDQRHVIALPFDVHGPMGSIYFHLIGGSQIYLIGFKPVFWLKILEILTTRYAKHKFMRSGI